MDRADYHHRAGWAHTEEAFIHAARQAARRELKEEAGIFLSTSHLEAMIPLPYPLAPTEQGNTARH
eukprot:9640485-Heterocapsa_arctica.AAC.1